VLLHSVCIVWASMTDGDPHCIGVVGLSTFLVLFAFAVGLHCTLPPFLIGCFILAHPDGPISLHDPVHVAACLQFTVGMGVLALIEFIADKVPFLDHGLHVLLLVGAPVVAMGAVTVLVDPRCMDKELRDALLVICGTFAIVMHTFRGVARGHASAAGGGMMNPVISLLEDCLAVLLLVAAYKFLSTIALTLALVLAIMAVLLVVWAILFLLDRMCCDPRSKMQREEDDLAARPAVAYYAPLPDHLAPPRPPDTGYVLSPEQALYQGAFAMPPASAPPPTEPLLRT